LSRIGDRATACKARDDTFRGSLEERAPTEWASNWTGWYTWLGDAVTELGPISPAGSFTDNSALGFGLNVGFNF